MRLSTRLKGIGWALMLCLGLSLETEAAVIRSVQIVHLGPGPLKEESVRPLLSLREGMEFDRAAVIVDVRVLQKTGRFSQVDVRAKPEGEGILLVVALRSKPRLTELTIEGQSDFSTSRVKELLELKPGDLVDEDRLAAGALRIQGEYKKTYHSNARVAWDIQVDEDTGLARVQVRIKEGRKVRVRSIQISGRTGIPEKELQGVLQQKVYHPWNPWHWVTSHGRWDPDMAEGDAYLIRKTYLNRGYLDAVVEGPEIREEEGRLLLKFTVQEGCLYRIGQVSLTGNTVYESAVLERVQGLIAPAPASLSGMDGATSALQDYYGNRGYFRTLVRRSIDADAKRGLVNVHFQIIEGVLSRIRDIRIQGNTTTQDKVILRELVIAPGDTYDNSRVRTSERRLRNLGYFKKVTASPLDTPAPDEQDLVFDVEEGQAGMASAGVGFSTIESVSGFFEVSHGNMDLREWPPLGGGQKLRLRLQAGTQSNTVETEFIEPWLFDRPLSLGINLFRSEFRYYSDDYDQRNTGMRLSLTRSLSTFWRGSLEYGLQNIEIFDVSDTASLQIQEEEGARIKSSLTPVLTYDTRRMDYRGALPTGGNLTRMSVGFAGGPLGGDTDLYELNVQSSQFISLWWRHVLILRGRAGVVEPTGGATEVPLFDRLFLGGPTNVRGFEYRSIGPRDETDEPIGGQSLAFASSEYTLPLAPNVRGAVFYDAGMVWADAYGFDSQWNTDYGIGLRLDIPMMPIRLDYAWPLETDEFTQKGDGRFSFWIGNSF